jgi:large subunit ribosomal protein L15
VGFEGGQMPLQRRLPKRGFTNAFKKEWIEVNVATLEKRFEPDAEVTPDALVAAGICSKRNLSTTAGIVVLAKGEITKPLRVSVHRASKSAREKIEKAGGSVTIIERAEA